MNPAFGRLQQNLERGLHSDFKASLSYAVRGKGPKLLKGNTQHTGWPFQTFEAHGSVGEGLRLTPLGDIQGVVTGLRMDSRPNMKNTCVHILSQAVHVLKHDTGRQRTVSGLEPALPFTTCISRARPLSLR